MRRVYVKTTANSGGSDGERDQREAPVEVEHHRHHAHQCQGVDQRTQHSRNNEALNRVDVAGHAADQIASPGVIVIGKR